MRVPSGEYEAMSSRLDEEIIASPPGDCTLPRAGDAFAGFSSTRYTFVSRCSRVNAIRFPRCAIARNHGLSPAKSIRRGVPPSALTRYIALSAPKFALPNERMNTISLPSGVHRGLTIGQSGVICFASPSGFKSADTAIT
jgi:hypothetical protein